MIIRILPPRRLLLMQINTRQRSSLKLNLLIRHRLRMLSSMTLRLIMSDFDGVDEEGADVLRTEGSDDGHTFFDGLSSDELGEEGVFDDEAGFGKEELRVRKGDSEGRCWI